MQPVKHTGLIVRPKHRQHACCGPDVGAAFAYLRSLEWHHSTHLVMMYSQLHPGLVVQQLTQSSWPSLAALHMTQVNLDLVLLRQLADGSWPRLVQLAIGGVPATNLGGMLGVATSAWPHLTSLAMRGFTASPFNLTNLPLRHLSSLKLRSIQFGRSVLPRSQAAGSSLRELEVRDSILDANAASMLFAASWPHLTKLSLCSDQICMRVIEELVSCDLPSLHKLKLTGSTVDSNAVARLANGQWPELKSLCLAGLPLDVAGVTCLTDGMWEKLSELRLDAEFPDPAAWALLSLHPTELTEDGYAILANSCTVQRNVNAALIWKQLNKVQFKITHRA